MNREHQKVTSGWWKGPVLDHGSRGPSQPHGCGYGTGSGTVGPGHWRQPPMPRQGCGVRGSQPKMLLHPSRTIRAVSAVDAAAEPHKMSAARGMASFMLVLRFMLVDHFFWRSTRLPARRTSVKVFLALQCPVAIGKHLERSGLIFWGLANI